MVDNMGRGSGLFWCVNVSSWVEIIHIKLYYLSNQEQFKFLQQELKLYQQNIPVHCSDRYEGERDIFINVVTYVNATFSSIPRPFCLRVELFYLPAISIALINLATIFLFWNKLCFYWWGLWEWVKHSHPHTSLLVTSLAPCSDIAIILSTFFNCFTMHIIFEVVIYIFHVQRLS